MKKIFALLLFCLSAHAGITVSPSGTVNNATNAANWTASGTTNSTLNGNAAVNSLTVTNANGINSTGATTISTATGQLYLKTGGGNANVVITPNGTGYTLLNGNVGIGTMVPLSLVHINSSDATDLWPTFLPGANSYTPLAGELTIQNAVLNTTNSYAGIFFNAGQTTVGAGISSARIGAIRESGQNASLVFATRNPTSDMTERMRITSSGNEGIGTPNPNSEFEDAGSFALNTTTGGAITLGSTNCIYLCNVNAQLVTLPSAVGIQNRIYVIKCIAPATTCTVTNATGGQNIDGVLSYSLSASNKFVRVVSDNINWWIIGSN